MVYLFKENFTPLFKVGLSDSVLLNDKLDIKFCRPARGPRGHCFSRSKYFLHDRKKFHGIRVIFNREKLAQRYRIYPLDEIYLNHEKDSKTGWFHNHGINVNKAAFPTYKNVEGKFVRQPRHGLKDIDFKECVLEQEFEERILTSITNLGKYIYAINFWDDKDIKENKHSNNIITNYIQKYQHIKVLVGYDKFEDKTNLVSN